ncbi:hypothetical protein NEDG_01689 [Nematocida displodere]|uniref:Uncharacterized protein n=1 Tax=Nematocida displodere TaxID=1805483 RepID=A0A177EEH0_9MICR|nr:hypothetical protein NEDG_01689 [Nematocida displodere]
MMKATLMVCLLALLARVSCSLPLVYTFDQSRSGPDTKNSLASSLKSDIIRSFGATSISKAHTPGVRHMKVSDGYYDFPEDTYKASYGSLNVQFEIGVRKRSGQTHRWVVWVESSKSNCSGKIIIKISDRYISIQANGALSHNDFYSLISSLEQLVHKAAMAFHCTMDQSQIKRVRERIGSS